MNLLEGLNYELKRNKELLSLYKDIPTGTFGAAFIEDDIKVAEWSILANDITQMITSYKKLKENK